MLDEFEIRLASKKNRMFPGDSLDKDRRKAEDQRRSQEAIRRKSLRDRRQQALEVEHNRRHEQRRKSERRKLEDRRVTSNWSEERLEEEREKIKKNKSGSLLFNFMTLSFFTILFLIAYLILTKMGL